MGYVSISSTGEIATHAALTQNVHGAGAYDILDSNDLSGYSKINSDSYTGNDSVNRAIPHGLGITPKYIQLLRVNGSGLQIQINGAAILAFVNQNESTQYAVTAADSTNFYVGHATSYANSGNGTGETYHWIAVG